MLDASISKFAEIKQMHIHSTPADMKIHQELSKVQVKSRPADLEIRTREADIKVDWTQTWEDLGLLRPSTLAKEQASKAVKEAAEGVVRKARNGDHIRDLTSGNKNPYGAISFQRFMERNHVETNVDVVPKHPPKFEVVTYKPDIQITAHTPKVKANDTRPVIKVRLGDVQIRVDKFV